MPYASTGSLRSSRPPGGLDGVDHIGRVGIGRDPVAELVLVVFGEGLTLGAGLDRDGLAVEVVERLDVTGFEHAELDAAGEVGSLKSNVCWRSSVIDMPAMTPSTWFDCRACRAASNPSWRISTSKP